MRTEGGKSKNENPTATVNKVKTDSGKRGVQVASVKQEESTFRWDEKKTLE